MYADIIVDISGDALEKVFTYQVPEGLDLNIGDKVTFPFGKKDAKREGYVIDLKDEDVSGKKLKMISERAKKGISVKEELLHLAVWMSHEYGTGLIKCLKTVLPVRKTVNQNSRRRDPLTDIRPSGKAQNILNNDQEECCRKIREAIISGQNKAFLLHGITGSGKTEVYLECLEENLNQGKQAIFLIPEISLCYQTVLRTVERFGEKVSVLHSRLSEGEKYDQYERMLKGEARILIGPRSAVFAPFDKLGLIIMDEEHEDAYKSDMSPRFITQDIVLKRADMADASVIFGSATPSMGIYKRALDGEICLLKLNKRAVAGSLLPAAEIIDLREELKKGNRTVFSGRLQELMEEELRNKRQIMLFINRRGFNTRVLCRSCGEILKCPHCSVSLTLHKDGKLRCHYCGYETPMKNKCPMCGSPYIAPIGLGTERLEALTRERFPGARILRMDADTTKGKNGHERILSEFRKGNADILVGTQMIVKGHDFPGVSLVGIILSDLSLSMPDYRAEEKTFQILMQAGGRAGRGKDRGHVIIQTYQPENEAVRLAKDGNYDSFAHRELAFRKKYSYPPYSEIFAVRLASKDEEFLKICSDKCFDHIRKISDRAEILGPMKASVYKLNDSYRRMIFIRNTSHTEGLFLRDELLRELKNTDKRGIVIPVFDIERY